jgi:integrase
VNGGVNLLVPTNDILAPITDFLDFALWLKRKHHIMDITIAVKIRKLKAIGRKVNLWDVEAFRDYIQDVKFKGGYKNSLGYVYADWCEYQGFEYKPYNFYAEKSLPYVPLEKEIDQLIGAFAHSKYGALLQLMKETAFRPIEAMRLTPRDFNLEQQIVTLNKLEKRSNPRQSKISDKLTAMIKQQVKGKRQNELIWSAKSKYIRRTFMRNRRRASKNLDNPNIEKISMKTFRHFKATMEYHKTKDILYIKKLLGHKNIQNTMVYIHLVNFESDEFVCKVAESVDEAGELVEAGFVFVIQFEGKMLFKKRK